MVLSVIKNNKTVRQKNSWFSAWRCPFLGFWGRFRDHQADLKAFLCLSVLEGEATRPSASSTNKKRHPRKDVSVKYWDILDYLFSAVATSTAQATVQPTIGLLPIPRNPIISTCAGTDDKPRAIKLVWIAEVRRRKSPQDLTDEELANWASECIRSIVSVIYPMTTVRTRCVRV